MAKLSFLFFFKLARNCSHTKMPSKPWPTQGERAVARRVVRPLELTWRPRLRADPPPVFGFGFPFLGKSRRKIVPASNVLGNPRPSRIISHLGPTAQFFAYRVKSVPFEGFLVCWTNRAFATGHWQPSTSDSCESLWARHRPRPPRPRASTSHPLRINRNRCRFCPQSNVSVFYPHAGGLRMPCSAIQPPQKLFAIRKCGSRAWQGFFVWYGPPQGKPLFVAAAGVLTRRWSKLPGSTLLCGACQKRKHMGFELST